jgi:hypothetical protein
VRKAFRHKAVYYALSVGLLGGGVLLLSFVNAPEWVVYAWIGGSWFVLMYLLRWRKR